MHLIKFCVGGTKIQCLTDFVNGVTINSLDNNQRAEKLEMNSNNNNNKNKIVKHMKRLIIGALLSISMVGFAQTGEKNFIDQNYIEVTGKAEWEISPNLIYLKIVLSDKNNKNRETLPEIERKMISKLTEIGIDVNKDLSLIDYVSSLRAYLLKTNVVLTKQYQLIVRDIKTLEKVFFEFQELGVSNVSISKLEHSEIEQFRKEVKVFAVKAAKEKAELLAISLNQKIGKAIYVQEVENVNRNTLQRSYAGTSSSNMIIRGISSNSSSVSMETDIEFEKIIIESTFLVRFALE